MTPDDFRAHLSRLGLSQVQAGKYLGYSGRTVRRWAAGGEDSDIPIVVQRLLRKIGPEDVEAWRGEREPKNRNA